MVKLLENIHLAIVTGLVLTLAVAYLGPLIAG